MSNYLMLISNKLHSFRNFESQSYNFIDTKPPVLGYKLKINPYCARG